MPSKLVLNGDNEIKHVTDTLYDSYIKVWFPNK